MRMGPNRRLSLAIVAVVAADWLTKFWVQNRLYENGVLPVVRNWVWLTHRRNAGVSFSFLADAPAVVRLPIVVGAAIAGIAVCARMLASTRDRGVALAAALVIAGAVGNLGDRLLNGGVTDFIQIRFFPFVFNVADVAITVGAVLLLARMALHGERESDGHAPA
ncbi:MAG: putative rane protein [Gemmatimonadetes bacterium]|nr:putative rane protein [Gemmatimonadota bacterium]